MWFKLLLMRFMVLVLQFIARTETKLNGPTDQTITLLESDLLMHITGVERWGEDYDGNNCL